MRKPLTIDYLLKNLASAVESRNYIRANRLAHRILHQYPAKKHDRDELRLIVQNMMSTLEQPDKEPITYNRYSRAGTIIKPYSRVRPKTTAVKTSRIMGKTRSNNYMILAESKKYKVEGVKANASIWYSQNEYPFTEKEFLKNISSQVVNIEIEATRNIKLLAGTRKHRCATLNSFGPPRRVSSRIKSPASVKASKPNGVIYPIWFGTNRKPSGDDGFLGSELNDRIIRGRIDVYIPKSHRFGEEGNSFWRRLLRFSLRNDRLKVQKITPLGKSDFYKEICQEMQSVRENENVPHALLYLHGFNVSFEDAARG